MKVIANIHEDMLQELKDGCFGAKHTLYDLAGAICDGVVLPDNATNGYMIKIMFPTWEIDMEDAEDEEYPVVTCWIDKSNNIWTSFDLSWWNAKWEGVQEE